MIRCTLCSRPPEAVAYMVVREATGAAICEHCAELAHQEIAEQRGKKLAAAAWKQVQSL